MGTTRDPQSSSGAAGRHSPSFIGKKLRIYTGVNNWDNVWRSTLFPGFEHGPVLAPAWPGARSPSLPGGTCRARRADPVLVTDLRLWARVRALCDLRESYGTFAPFV